MKKKATLLVHNEHHCIFQESQFYSQEKHTKFEHLFHHVVFVEKLNIELI